MLTPTAFRAITFIRAFNLIYCFKSIPVTLARSRQEKRSERQEVSFHVNSAMNLHIYFMVLLYMCVCCSCCDCKVVKSKKMYTYPFACTSVKIFSLNNNRNVFHYIKFILIDVNEEHWTLERKPHNIFKCVYRARRAHVKYFHRK